jgi:hypothetical protein
MTETEQLINIAKKVGELVDTNHTITDLEECLENAGVTYLDESEWEKLVHLLEMYYIIPNKSYPYGVIESYLEDTLQFN